MLLMYPSADAFDAEDLKHLVLETHEREHAKDEQEWHDNDSWGS